MSGGNVNDNNSPDAYYYLPGKYEKSPLNNQQKRETDILVKQDNKVGLDTCYNPSNFDNVSEYLQSTDIALKNLHRKWSNID